VFKHCLLLCGLFLAAFSIRAEAICEGAPVVDVPSTTASTADADKYQYFKTSTETDGDLIVYTEGSLAPTIKVYGPDGVPLNIEADDRALELNNVYRIPILGAADYCVEVQPNTTTGTYHLVVALDSASDDHGYDCDNATELAIDGKAAVFQSGELSPYLDRDYFNFRIDLDNTQIVLDPVSDGGSLYGLLLKDNASYKGNANASNFNFTTALPAGEYCLEIGGYYGTSSGAYEIRLDADVDGDDHGTKSDLRTATVVHKGEGTSAVIPGTIGQRLESDVFQFQVSANSSLVEIATEGDTSIKGKILDSNGNAVEGAADTGSGDVSLSETLDAGLYYLVLEGYNTSALGPYNVVFEGDLGNPPETCNDLPVTIHGTNGNDLIMGTEGDDVIAGYEGRDTIYGKGGKDTICGGNDEDVLYGGNGNDQLSGQAGDDVLLGQGDKDKLNGGGDNDICSGGSGDNDDAKKCEVISEVP